MVAWGMLEAYANCKQLLLLHNMLVPHHFVHLQCAGIRTHYVQ